MKTWICKRFFCLALVAALMLPITAGCGANPTSSISSEAAENEAMPDSDAGNVIATPPASTSASEADVNMNGIQTKEDSELQAKTDAEEKERTEEERRIAEEEARRRAEEERIRTEQRNSFSMMYYLAITAEEIRSSRNNRLVLDEIYTSLLNDINPGAIDEITQDHLKNLRDIIKSYLLISTKRERLQYIYNQEKAAAIRSAVPNPLAILSVSNALDWKKLAVSVVYAAVDSYSNFRNASDNADSNFLMSGWELDDAEIATIQKNRDRAFDYMVDMVQEYDLDGMLTLNEKAIESFAEICNIESVHERTRRLITEEKTYGLLSNYWLELADCYFETNQYDKCLDCVDKYRDLSAGIYRKDVNYARILPKAIVAAQKTYKDEQYNTIIHTFAEELINNTSTEDWSSRYFVAQVYLDLYARSKDRQYLDAAYQIALDNVTVLLKEQRALNATYLEDVRELTVDEPDYSFLSEQEKKEKKEWYKQEKARVKTYNKEMREMRKTELPSLYEPLLLNCEMLFELATEMNISYEQKREIEAILDTASNGIFLSKPINDFYSFNNKKQQYSAVLTKETLAIPADLLTEGAHIHVSVAENGSTTSFDDCVVQKVVRKGQTIDTFEAQISSKQMKEYSWTPDSKVLVTITYDDAYSKTINLNFEVSYFLDRLLSDKVEFEQK